MNEVGKIGEDVACMFLKKHKYVGSGTKHGQDWGYYEAGKLLGNYGWRTKEVD